MFSPWHAQRRISRQIQYVGGLIGIQDYGCVSDSWADVSIECGSLADAVGGLVGGALRPGSVLRCYAHGSLCVLNNSTRIGGLAGCHTGLIEHGYSAGHLIAGEDSTDVGGLLGTTVNGRDYGTTRGGYWDIQTGGLSTSAGGNGLSTSAMKRRASFNRWDFVGESVNGTADAWRMCADGVDYPRLSWEFSQHGDLDCPDGVGFDDLTYLAERWLNEEDAALLGAADVNADGRIEQHDFARISEYWLYDVR